MGDTTLERSLVQTLLDMANDGGVCPTPGPIMAELCRVYLAVADAPVVELQVAFDHLGNEWLTCGDDLANEVLHALNGQTVRLVPTGPQPRQQGEGNG